VRGRIVLCNSLWYTENSVIILADRCQQILELEMTIRQDQINRAIKLAKAYGATRLNFLGAPPANPRRREILIWHARVLLDGSFMSWVHGSKKNYECR
jgi:hypothetical protein